MNATWLPEILETLAARPVVGYLPAAAPAAEPTAILALALAAHARLEPAQKATAALAEWQRDDGSVPVRPGEENPGWTTSLALVAWCAIDRAHFREPIARATQWLLAAKGEAIEQSSAYGHDASIVGWSWAAATHSWAEPTALSVLALKAAGQSQHRRTRDGVRLLLDRQIATGGLNYGNTTVLGQITRPHVQPTGIALLALAGERDPSGRLPRTRGWLLRQLGQATAAPSSLAWSLLGLRANGEVPPEADAWLAAAAERIKARDGAPHKLALVALAAKGWPA